MDTAKAVSAVHGTETAAIPTTLAGSTFTPFHRLPEGAAGAMHRPSLAICEPAAMVPADAPLLAATAMNALAHAIESLYAPLANPVTEEAALRSARLFADALPRDPAPAPALAEAAFLAGYAVGNAGLAVHHAVCQTIVRTCGTPHAQTNAVMLPHSVRLMSLARPVKSPAWPERWAIRPRTPRRPRAGCRTWRPARATRACRPSECGRISYRRSWRAFGSTRAWP